MRTAAVVCSVVLAFATHCESQTRGQSWPSAKLAPFVTSTKQVVRRMLRFAGVRKTDVVYDLGAGDGRVVLIAAQEFGATAIGIELDKDLCAKAEANIQKLLGSKSTARMICDNAFTVDFGDATVVTLFLTTLGNAKLRRNLEKHLRKGARVVSYSFEVPGWKPTATEAWKEERFRHTLYLYVR